MLGFDGGSPWHVRQGACGPRRTTPARRLADATAAGSMLHPFLPFLPPGSLAAFHVPHPSRHHLRASTQAQKKRSLPTVDGPLVRAEVLDKLHAASRF